MTVLSAAQLEQTPMDSLSDLAARVMGVDLFDLERVAVLRGPRGTSDPMSATAGAIDFVGHRPMRAAALDPLSALARRWLKVPVLNQLLGGDPRASTSIRRAVLADAIALQGREEEARKTLAPALAYYREQQQAGARGTTFRHDFAYALYVGAISSPADASGRAQRRADLDEASQLIEGASAQAPSRRRRRRTPISRSSAGCTARRPITQHARGCTSTASSASSVARA